MQPIIRNFRHYHILGKSLHNFCTFTSKTTDLVTPEKGDILSENSTNEISNEVHVPTENEMDLLTFSDQEFKLRSADNPHSEVALRQHFETNFIEFQDK